MKPLSILYASLIFVVVVVSGLGWYGGMVSEYADIGAHSKIESARINATALRISENITSQKGEIESGTRDFIQQLPVIGDAGVQLYNSAQALKNLMTMVMASLDLATELLGGELLGLLFPGFNIPAIIIGVIATALVIMVVGAVVYILLNREAD